MCIFKMESSEKPWIVVHFIEEDTVEAVPRIWYIFDSNMCIWPPKQLNKHLPDLIKNKEIPNENWPTFPAKILGQYEDFQTAKRKAVKAQDTTDLSSNCENVKTVKRKKLQNLKYISTDSESNLDSDEDTYPPLPKKHTLSQPISDKRRLSLHQHQNNSQRLYNATPQSSQLIPDIAQKQLHQFDRIRSQTDSPQSSRSQIRDSQNLRRNDEVQRQTNNSSKFLSNSPRASSGSSMEMREFQRQVLNQLNILSAKISDNTDTLQMLLEQKYTNEENKENDLLDNVIQLFPLKENYQLTELEEFLSLNSNMTPMAKELSRMGGDSAKELVKKIMYRTVSNELGQLFSWDGAKGKRPFKSLLLSQVILKAVRINRRTKNSDEDESIKTIKLWLVRAKDRLKNNLEKKQRINNQHEQTEVELNN